ncbi:cytochrome c oxidase subunit 8C, mitochondrial isoform X2 [Lynx rufus]|uniref:cytochrome c oxidase subunit 8C, mitochondrial isoform X2 n=1 Tax=Lynx rufus TaxID=61384 RepID=UPI001F122A3A|nr:cytochrome c oxidase subunit 8C, mitochondrial isoform X2 [Lynx rufus]XP_046936139.1 cytochrome c oxidase subunit 8C, mitochondrial isoform X2 [Lynx rufus]
MSWLTKIIWYHQLIQTGPEPDFRQKVTASSRFASPDAMPRLLVLRLLPCRRVTQLGLQPGRRLARSESRRRQHPKSSVDSAIALVMVFATFLAPSGYVLSNLSDLRRA